MQNVSSHIVTITIKESLREAVETVPGAVKEAINSSFSPSFSLFDHFFISSTSAIIILYRPGGGKLASNGAGCFQERVDRAGLHHHL